MPARVGAVLLSAHGAHPPRSSADGWAPPRSRSLLVWGIQVAQGPQAATQLGEMEVTGYAMRLAPHRGEFAHRRHVAEGEQLFADDLVRLAALPRDQDDV